MFLQLIICSEFVWKNVGTLKTVEGMIQICLQFFMEMKSFVLLILLQEGLWE